MTKLISLTLLAIGVSVMACKAGSTPVIAAKCYVVQGDKARHLEVDNLARLLATERGFEIVGQDSSALVLSRKNTPGKIVITSPFGKYISILSFFDSQPPNSGLGVMIEEIASSVRNIGLTVEHCASVPGLRTPSIPSEAL